MRLKSVWKEFVSVVVLIAVILLISRVSPPKVGYAAYQRPVPSGDMNELDLRQVLRSQYASRGNLLEPVISDSTFDLVLKDADNRIAKEFRIPSAMKPTVEFWLKVYTIYTTQHALIFDSNHPEIVYEVLDLRTIGSKAKNHRAFWQKSRGKISETMAGYQKAFASLNANPKPKSKNRFQRNILSAIRKVKHSHSFADLAKSVKVQIGQRDNVIKGLLGAEAFFPKMEWIFSQMNIPTELTRLSLVESSFDFNALSRVGALGVWQFMPDSGREYLIMDSKRRIDERLSPLKSTVAAGKLLIRNYRYLGNWAMAITAYNHGAKNLPRFRRKTENFARVAHLFSEPCKVKGKLAYASRNYFGEFLAVLYAESYRHLFYGDPPPSTLRAVGFEKLPRSLTGIEVALAHGVSVQEFKFYNPDVIDLRKKLPRGFWIALPSEKDSIGGLLGGAETLVSSVPRDSRRRVIRQ